MSNVDIKSRITEVLKRDLELSLSTEEILRDGRLDGLFGMDSVAVIELIIGIEREFGIKIPQEYLNMEVFGNIDTIAGAVKNILDGRSGPDQ